MVGETGTLLLQTILPLLVAIMVLIIVMRQVQSAGAREVIMAITLSALSGGIAFLIVKAICEAL